MNRGASAWTDEHGPIKTLGTQPGGHSGFMLVGNLVSQEGIDKTQAIAVKVGPLIGLLHYAVDMGVLEKDTKNLGDNYRGRVEWHGLDITVTTHGDPEELARGDDLTVLRVKIFHNPGLNPDGEQIQEGRGEHHTVFFGSANRDPKGVVRLTEGDDPRRDLVEPLIFKSGNRERV